MQLTEGRLTEALAGAERIALSLEASAALAATDDALAPRLICHRI